MDGAKKKGKENRKKEERTARIKGRKRIEEKEKGGKGVMQGRKIKEDVRQETKGSERQKTERRKWEDRR